MRIIDKFGSDVALEDLEPWTTYIEDNDGGRTPITKITYRVSSIEIEWQIK